MGGTAGEEEAAGGTFGVTAGLAAEFGRGRVIDTPITESAIVGAANGAALTGLRPVAEVMFMDFIGVCLDQILNQMAKFRYMFGGKCTVPVTIRTLMGAGYRRGPAALAEPVRNADRRSRASRSPARHRRRTRRACSRRRSATTTR